MIGTRFFHDLDWSRNMLAGVLLAINSSGIALHGTKECNQAGCKEICVLAIFQDLNLAWEGMCRTEEARRESFTVAVSCGTRLYMLGVPGCVWWF